MLLRHLRTPHPRDVVAHVDDVDATIADLAEALDPGRPVGPLLVDGRLVAAATPLDRAAIGDGATVARPGPARPRPDEGTGPALVTVTTTTGVDAGRTFSLPAGVALLGRADGTPPCAEASAPPGPGPRRLEVADPTVSAAHLRLDVAADGTVVATDLGSTNGSRDGATALDGPTRLTPGRELRCGACTLRVDRPPPPTDPLPTAPSAGGTRPLHRRPRPAPPAPQVALAAPAPLEAAPPITPVGLVAVLASVAVGGAMVVILGSWTYAAFALLGPVLLIAGALDARHRRRRSRRRGARRRRRELARFEADLAERARAEVTARSACHPGAAAAVAIATGGGGSCWERRPDHPDAFAVCLGHGPAPWTPSVVGEHDDDVTAAIGRHQVLPHGPIGLTLTPGRAVALVGPRSATAALARSLVVQAATGHGPADLAVAVLAGAAHASDWDWCAWLPHARAGGPSLAADDATAATVASALVPGATPSAGPSPAGPRTIVVVDHPEALAARRSPARTVLRAATDPALGLVPIVLVAHEHDVPASCQLVLSVDPDGTLRGPPSSVAGPAVVAGLAVDVATDAARALARFDDPELTEVGRGLPDAAGLGALLGPDRTGAAALAARWGASGPDPAPRATLGRAADGPFVVDLAVDGPHALVAGTTGSGKSELLRSLVASLAVSSSPDHLTFVLVDFKGGGAFDACARLPHTTGVVTDLDGHLARRALRCLDAELRHRERRLRAVGADDLADLRRHHPREAPLPRLVVVVDEFATLAAELPDFVASLVGIAQRGRSLGVHLVLATQRPSGSVSDHIRANAALRIALRVQAAADSTDVIDVPDAATLPRHRPGRALVRLGPGELIPIQAALATGPAAAGGGGEAGGGAGRVRIEPLGLAASAGPSGAAVEPASDGPTDLAVIVAAASRAWTDLGGARPRRPWPDPLPREVAWPVTARRPEPDDAGSAPVELAIGLADHPDRQAQEPFTWRLDAGPLLVVGLPGSGTTTAAATTVLAAAHRWSPAACHVHAIDLGAGELVALAGLPHVGAVVAADDLERQRRLLADLADDLAARRARPAADRVRRIVVVDGLAGFRARWDDIEPSGTWERLVEVATRGTEVGIHVLLTAEGPAAAPHRLLTACAQRLVLRLGEAADHAAFGIPAGAVPDLPPGRGLEATGATLVQVARPAGGLAPAVARLAGRHEAPGGRLPSPVGVLGDDEPLDRLLAGVGSRPEEGTDLRLLVGRSDRALAPAHLVLAPGGHALVTGPPRSGRSTALATIARSASALGVPVLLVGRAGPAWPEAVRALDPDDPVLATVLDVRGPLLVLVDDAERTADDHPVLRDLVQDRRPDRHVVAAGRSDRLRSRYAHWTREVQADRCGLLLRPDLDLDGDLLGTSLPRRLPLPATPGRGWLVGGDPEGLLQVARGRPPHLGPAERLPS